MVRVPVHGSLECFCLKGLPLLNKHSLWLPEIKVIQSPSSETNVRLLAITKKVSLQAEHSKLTESKVSLLSNPGLPRRSTHTYLSI